MTDDKLSNLIYKLSRIKSISRYLVPQARNHPTTIHYIRIVNVGLMRYHSDEYISIETADGTYNHVSVRLIEMCNDFTAKFSRTERLILDLDE